MPRLTIVLSTIGMYPELRRVLDGYDRQDAEPGSFEVLVVTDMAEPDPAAVEAAIGERSFPVRRITGRRPGLSANRNTGRLAARSPLVMFTDNDTIPVPGLVSEHLAWHERHPEDEVAVVGLVRWAPELQITTFMRWLDAGIQFDYPNVQGIEAGWGRFYGANSSVKAAFAERVGDFDEQRLPYGYEDTDWACRADELGFRVLLNRAAVVDHLRPMTLEFWKKRARRLGVAERQFVHMHPDVPPFFWNLFTEAVAQRPASTRGVWLAPYVSPSVPLLGPRVWTSVDLHYRQQLAPHFLEAWEAWEPSAEPVGADLSERPDL